MDKARQPPPGLGLAATSEKVLLILGGTSGIGLETARQASNRGHWVFISGRDPSRLAAALGELSSPSRCDGSPGDVTSAGDVREVVRAAVERFGRIDVLVTSVGKGAKGDLASGDPVEWREMVETNVLGPALAVRECLAHLAHAAGQIVLVGSVLGRVSVPGSLYSVTKHAMSALAEATRQQVLGSGIRVCVVNPGRVDTPWWPDGAKPPALDPAHVASLIIAVAESPMEVDVSEIVVRPTGQRL